ncbi:hypothetical protein NC652_000137 [Populus alba x Populus x berolinensis]|nr:hypothetical protein NC652_000137 [Populus alba x Populus x berolinensis]
MLFCSGGGGGGGGCCTAAHLFKHWFQSWLRDYDSLQHLALILIYIQIGCSLIGSLGALYNGVLLINLAISLFALVAIESSSQRLGRTYAVLLFSSLLLDIAWFILFSRPIWDISSDDREMFFVFSVKLTLAMQIIGFIIYRLGVPYIDSLAPQEADFDLRSSFLSPTTPAAVARQCSDSDVVLGGSIYDPAYFSSLFEDGQDNKCLRGDQNYGICDNGSTSSAEASQSRNKIWSKPVSSPLRSIPGWMVESKGGPGGSQGGGGCNRQASNCLNRVTDLGRLWLHSHSPY